MKPYEFLSHPADIKLKASGQDLAELFSNCARGMMSFIYGEKVACKKYTKKEEISLEAKDLSALLVDWLSELLYLSNSTYNTFLDFEFKEISAKGAPSGLAGRGGSGGEESKLVAIAKGCKAEAEDDIKAVTYSELEIKQKKDGWEAIIVFDI